MGDSFSYYSSSFVDNKGTKRTKVQSHALTLILLRSDLLQACAHCTIWFSQIRRFDIM